MVKRYKKTYKTGQQIARESIKRFGRSNNSMSDHKHIANNINPKKRKYFWKEINKHW